MAPSVRKKRPSATEDDDSPSKRSKAYSVDSEEQPNDKENANNEADSDFEDEPAAATEESEVEETQEEQADDVDMEEEEEDALTAADALGRRKSHTNSQAGILHSVECENFMCHRHLKVNLNRNVNFIHGQNGSGKSAILAAIQICLGASARRTHRASSLKNLIRKDGASMPSCAIVKVTLLNHGSDGYKHDEYGDTITIERRIAYSGGYNGYKLRDHQGNEVSRSKKDLDEILDTLNIQVENPVAVLDQEEAKKFITGKAQDKYNFFMKATELERLDVTYRRIVEAIQEMSASNERARATLQAESDHVAKLKKKYQQHQEVAKLQLKEQKQMTEWAWAHYKDLAVEKDEALESRDKFEEKAQAKLAELQTAEENAKSPEEEVDSRKAALEALVQETQELVKNKDALTEQLVEAQAPYKDADRKLKSVKKRQRQAEKELKAAQQRLQDARDQILKNAESAESEEARRTELLKKTEEQLQEARSQVDPLRQEQSNWYREFEEIEPHVMEARGRLETATHTLRGIEKTIRSLQSSSGNRLAVFGPNVTKLADLVAKAKRSNRFKGEVVGPIGAYIKVNQDKSDLAALAERALGRNLDRFISTNDHDSKVLRHLRRQAGCNQDCGIFQVYKTNRFSVPPPPDIDGIETIASVLNISNDLVFNCLVDNLQIERKALARDLQYSERELRGPNSIKYNMTEVFCLPRGDSWSMRGGAYFLASNDRPMRQTIGVDRGAALEDARREEDQAKREFQVAQREENAIDAKHTDAQKKWNAAKRSIRKNDELIEKLSSKIDSIKEEIDNSANQTVDTFQYDEDVQAAQEAVESLKSTENACLAEIEQCKPRLDEIKARLDEITLRNEAALAEMTEAQNNLTQFLETQTQKQSHLEKLRRKLEKYNEVRDKYAAKIEETNLVAHSALNKARILHWKWMQQKNKKQGQPADEDGEDLAPAEPTKEDLEAIEPVSVKLSAEQYEVRIKTTQAKIQQEKERRSVAGEDPMVARDKYLKAKEAFLKKSQQVEVNEKRVEEMTQDCSHRQKRWRKFRARLATLTTIKFGEMLTLNKYSGELDFDVEEGTLDLSVRKGTTDNAQGSKDVKALSGGERSFTTMCLLIALGETLETPFRILDEFDVFLDAQVRKLTIKSLIHVAKKLKHRQFIFITPQDLSSINPDPELTILKLRPPVRSKEASTLSQQTLS